MDAETIPPDARCVFVEKPAGGGSNRCPDEPIYRVWVEDCQDCAEFGRQQLGLSAMECVGHWACIRHAAEVRAGKYDLPDGPAHRVRRIRSIGTALH